MKDKSILHFSAAIESEIDQYLHDGKGIEAIVKAKYNITDIMDYEQDINEKSRAQLGFKKMRGNLNLIQGNIRTFEEAQEIIDAAINFGCPSI